MLYVKFDGDIPVDASYDPPTVKVEIEVLRLDGKKLFIDEPDGDWRNRNDWASLKQVERIARLLTINTRRTFLGTDEGSNVSPRFDVIEPPKVGEAVSYTFNCDYYPDGYISKITPTFQIITDTGSRYLRRKESSTWLKAGGTWALVEGHHSEKNPSF